MVLMFLAVIYGVERSLGLSVSTHMEDRPVAQVLPPCPATWRRVREI